MKKVAEVVGTYDLYDLVACIEDKLGILTRLLRPYDRSQKYSRPALLWVSSKETASISGKKLLSLRRKDEYSEEKKNGNRDE